MKKFAIIPSGGSGTRTGLDLPKQYIKVNGKEVIVYTLEVFQNCPKIDEIIIAAKPEFFELLYSIRIKYNLTKVTKIVEGGKERQDSVYNALLAIPPNSFNSLVAVHDAARPLLPINVLLKALDDAETYGNSVVAIKAKDTLIKHSTNNFDYVDRSEIYYVQTPQIFYYQDLVDAFNKAKQENFYGTDESMLVSRLGKKINITIGSSFNFKVTNADDLEMLNALI